MKQKRDLQTLIKDMEYPESVAQAVHEQVALDGTEERIVRGELQLPHPTDAAAWFNRREEEAGRRKVNQASPDTVQALMDRISHLEGLHHQQQHQPGAPVVPPPQPVNPPNAADQPTNQGE